MAVSTEATVRDVIVAAIQGVAADIGFADPVGNVKDYLLEFHQDEQVAAYLRARVGNQFIPYAWAVQVLGYDEPFAMRGVAKRTYEITIEGYRIKGVDGAPWNDLINAARVIRGEINDISPSLSGTATLIRSAVGLNPSFRDTQAGTLVVGTMRYTAERTNPDFTA